MFTVISLCRHSISGPQASVEITHIYCLGLEDHLEDPSYGPLAHGHPFVCGHLQDLGVGLTNQWFAFQLVLYASLSGLLYGSQGVPAAFHLACKGHSGK